MLKMAFSPVLRSYRGTLSIPAQQCALFVPLNASSREAPAVYIASRLGAEKPLFKAVAARWPNSPEARESLFLSQKREVLTTSAMGQMIAELVRAAGGLALEETSACTLQHSFTRSYLAQYPGDVVGLATLLGHRSLGTTWLYSQLEVSQLAIRKRLLNIYAYAR
jgi:site-specific recombinase XerD